MAMIAVFHLWVFYPITIQLTAWYASSFIPARIIMLSMAIYGFYISLGGQKVFGGKLLQED